MKYRKLLILCFGISLSVSANNSANDEQASADDSNQALPNILYVVPWKDSKGTQKGKTKLVLHDLIGDLYEPQLATDWE
jgi:hypothetical protein